MAYAVGPISGGHFNPAVTCGLVARPLRRRQSRFLHHRAGARGVAAAAVFYLILQGAPAAGKWNTFLGAGPIPMAARAFR